MLAASRIVVRAPNWIGDQVMAIPFYQALRELYPDAEISLFGVPAVLALPLPVTFVQRLALVRAGGSTPWRFWKQSRALRSHRFDLAITLTASLSSALLLRAAGIGQRVGFAETAARWLLTNPV